MAICNSLMAISEGHGGFGCRAHPSLQLSPPSSQERWSRARPAHAAGVSYRPTHAFSDAVATPATETRFVAPELIQLVARAQGGDLAAQSDLVRRYTPRVAGLVRTIVSQRSAIEDIVQIVCVKMVRSLHLLREPRMFEPWLFALARNASLDVIRRRQRRPEMVSVEQEFIDAPDLSNPRAVTEIFEALDLALVRLKPTDRRLILLIAQGHSYRTVAQRVGLTTGAVKVRLHRMRPVLREVVGQAIGCDFAARRHAA